MFTSPVPTSPGFPDPCLPDLWLIRAEEATPDMDFVFEEGSRAQGATLKALFFLAISNINFLILFPVLILPLYLMNISLKRIFLLSVCVSSCCN